MNQPRRSATSPLARVHFLSACTPSELARLAPLAREVRYKRFAPIYNAGDAATHVYAVLKGDVTLFRDRPGHEEPARLAVVREGELFGFGEAMLPAYYTSACAATACTLLAIRSVDFAREFLAIASIRNPVIESLSKINRYLLDRVTDGDGRTALALYLTSLAKDCGQREGPRIHIQRKQRQPAIASLLNLSREHVTRLFSQLKKEGVVDFNDGFPLIDAAWLDQSVRDKDLAASIQYRDTPNSDPHH